MKKNVQAFFKSIRILALSDSEKDILRQQIKRSLATSGKKRFKTGNSTLTSRDRKTGTLAFAGRARWVYPLAAAVLFLGLVLGSVWVYRHQPGQGMMNYVQSLDIPQAGDNTLLILGGQKEIPIALENANINYQSGGRSILINHEKKIENTEVHVKQDFHTVIVPYGKRLNMVLADGTIVWLNSGSKLVYPAHFKPGKREVFLEGEAIFDVAKRSGDRFLVNTNHFIVNVTGTVFNVTAYSDDAASGAVLAEGKIELSSRGNLFSEKTIHMLPGTKVVFDPVSKSMSVRQVNPDDYLSWRDGFMMIRGEKLPDILKKLSRYYNVGMNLEDQSIADETFSGRLDLKDSPREVLTVISRMVPLSVREVNDKLIIKSTSMSE